MVWSEHDNNFKALNSQLLKECDAADWVSRPGVLLGLKSHLASRSLSCHFCFCAA
jgi:hypothetical protein